MGCQRAVLVFSEGVFESNEVGVSESALDLALPSGAVRPIVVSTSASSNWMSSHKVREAARLVQTLICNPVVEKFSCCSVERSNEGVEC